MLPGSCEAVVVITVNMQELKKALDKEAQERSISAMTEMFYSEAFSYVEKLEATDKEIVKGEARSARKAIEELCDRRLGKILALAQTKNPPPSGLTMVEKEIYLSVQRTVEEGRKTLRKKSS